MTDEQFRQLRQMMLDQGVQIADLALAVRTLQRRLEELAANASAGHLPLDVSTEVNEFILRMKDQVNLSPPK